MCPNRPSVAPLGLARALLCHGRSWRRATKARNRPFCQNPAETGTLYSLVLGLLAYLRPDTKAVDTPHKQIAPECEVPYLTWKGLLVVRYAPDPIRRKPPGRGGRPANRVLRKQHQGSPGPHEATLVLLIQRLSPKQLPSTLAESWASVTKTRRCLHWDTRA